MERFRKGIAASLIVGLVAAWLPAMSSWALTDTAGVGVSATLPLRAELSMVRRGNSVGAGRGAVDLVTFDRYDDQDGQADGNPLFMYAPYRSEVGLNWHLANIIANGSSMDLTATVVSPQGAAVDLANIMDVFCGGFFEPFPPPNDKGGKSTDWELLNGFSRHFDEPLTAEAPFGYRLRLRGVVAGSHTGTITYTLISTI